jgi:predicted RNase H-like nuclease (RuvC/YqgF family)
MHPSREEFNELVFYIAGLKSQFTSKIDEQTIKINDHSEIVEELLWQIRELSDKIRQMNQKVEKLEKKLQDVEKKSSENNCICHYQNHLIPARIRPSRSIFSRQTSMLSRKSNSIRSVIAKRGISKVILECFFYQ